MNTSKEPLKLLKGYKTEIALTPEQAKKLKQTIGVCRFVYNLFIAENTERHKQGLQFMSGASFSKWLNNSYIPLNPDKQWIKDVSSKSVKKSIMNAEAAFKKFFTSCAEFPKYKKKGRNDPKMYFVKNDATSVIHCERHRIKIPTIGWVRLKEYGYLPTNNTIRSGTVSIRAGRYFISVLADVPENQKNNTGNNNPGIGIDLGIKDFAVASNGTVYGNINHTSKIRRLEKKLRREQRRLSRKYEACKKEKLTKEEKGARQNIQKQQLTVQKIHYALEAVRTDYINKTIYELVKTKPAYITIETLNISGMLKNRHLSKAVANQKFYEFRTKLINKCHQEGIEIRLADMFFPSSKMCHSCGKIKADLKLKDRTYICECGYKADRDFNAALNLRDANEYKTA